MSQPLPAPQRRPAGGWSRALLIVASALLLAGAWLMLESAGVRLPPLSRHWPLFMIAGALASIADWAFVSRRAGALGRGVFVLVLGVVVYLVTTERIDWHHVSRWGPGVYLALGLGCFAGWAASGQRSAGLLVVGILGVALAITFWGWGTIPLGLFWGGLLLLFGVAMVMAVLRRDRGA
jgi:hypothetical protein